MAGDPFFNSVRLLQHYATDFSDSSNLHSTFASSGGATISTTPGMWDKALSVAPGKYLYSNVHTYGITNFSGDFTVEVWARWPGSTTAAAIVGAWEATNVNDNWYLFISGGSLIFRQGHSNGTNTDTSTTFSPTSGQWYHIAFDQSSLTQRLYVDGVMKAKSTGPSVMNAHANPLTIGRVGPSFTSLDAPTGTLYDDLRITDGIARYKSDAGFTKPTSPYPDSLPPVGGDSLRLFPGIQSVRLFPSDSLRLFPEA